jgi:hypothetical protein
MSISVRGLISQEGERVWHAHLARDFTGGTLAPLVRTEEKPLAIAHERLSGELLGLTCVLAVTFGKKVSQ